ncbi:hypothetical protein VUR80DRAFT_7526 [Thermomyces stellatus]
MSANEFIVKMDNFRFQGVCPCPPGIASATTRSESAKPQRRLTFHPGDLGRRRCLRTHQAKAIVNVTYNASDRHLAQGLWQDTKTTKATSCRTHEDDDILFIS